MTSDTQRPSPAAWKWALDYPVPVAVLTLNLWMALTGRPFLVFAYPRAAAMCLVVFSVVLLLLMWRRDTSGSTRIPLLGHLALAAILIVSLVVGVAAA